MVCAGFVRTELWGNIPESERDALFAKAGQMLPVGKVGGADDLAETYLYLMGGLTPETDEQRFIEGAKTLDFYTDCKGEELFTSIRNNHCKKLANR